MVATLNIDIYDAILTHVDNKRDLGNCALVSHDWYPFATKYLFRTIRFVNTPILFSADWCELLEFLRTSENRRHIQELWLDSPRDYMPGSNTMSSRPSTLTPDVLSDILQALPNLATLYIGCTQSLFSILLMPGSRRPGPARYSLRRLAIGRSINEGSPSRFLELLSLFSHIETLQCHLDGHILAMSEAASYHVTPSLTLRHLDYCFDGFGDPLPDRIPGDRCVPLRVLLPILANPSGLRRIKGAAVTDLRSLNDLDAFIGSKALQIEDLSLRVYSQVKGRASQIMHSEPLMLKSLRRCNKLRTVSVTMEMKEIRQPWIAGTGGVPDVAAFIIALRIALAATLLSSSLRQLELVVCIASDGLLSLHPLHPETVVQALKRLPWHLLDRVVPPELNLRTRGLQFDIRIDTSEDGRGFSSEPWLAEELKEIVQGKILSLTNEVICFPEA